MRLILSDTEIKYEPSFHDFEVSMLNMIDIIIKSCANIPRVETRLYSDSAIQVTLFKTLASVKFKTLIYLTIKQQPGLKKDASGGLIPVILSNIVEAHKKRVADVINAESSGPINHSKSFDKYTSLITKKAEDEIDSFLKEDHSFNEYEKDVKKYQKLVKEITFSSHKIVRVGMFELHCEELIGSLAKRASSLLNKLIDRMLNEHFEINKK